MSKRSCRRSAEENKHHEVAVKIRKMTDKQIFDYIETLKSKPETKEVTKSKNIDGFLEDLINSDIPGIGKITMHKIRQFACDRGYIG